MKQEHLDAAIADFRNQIPELITQGLRSPLLQQVIDSQRKALNLAAEFRHEFAAYRHNCKKRKQCKGDPLFEKSTKENWTRLCQLSEELKRALQQPDHMKN